MNRRLYSHSGARPPAGLICGLACGAAAAVIVALVYALISQFNRFVYLEAVLAVCTGLLSAYACLWGLRLGSVRSDSAELILTAVSGVLTFYASWIFWVAMKLHRPGMGLVPFLDMLKHPAVFWDTVLWINQRGTWGFLSGSDPVTGASLWAVWGLEALCVIGGAALLSRMMRHWYCEQCRTWCVDESGIGNLAWTDVGTLRRHLRSGDIGYIRSLGRPKPDDTNWFKVKLSSCPACDSLHVLSLIAVNQNLFLMPWGAGVKDILWNPLVVNGLLVDDAEAAVIREAVRTSTEFDGNI